MTDMHIGVSAKGAIRLGDKVTCDGFVHGYPVRVQTHTHMDHMDHFDSSKGYQEIVVTPATRDLLIAEYDGDLAWRENIHALQAGSSSMYGGCIVNLVDNGHMLGAVQVAVTLPNGVRCGYSGDFSWPIPEVIEVDELVVDTTYGSPESVRRFTQDQADQDLVSIVAARLKFGPVYLKSHRGTLQRALHLLDGQIHCPIIVTPRVAEEIAVYRNHGYSHVQVIQAGTPEAKSEMLGSRYIQVFGHRDKPHTNPNAGTTICLSAFMSRTDSPVIEYSDNSFAVALSDHADYDGTIDYVRATKAKKVVTDNTRGGHAVELALALKRELGVDARPSEVIHDSAWGT